VTIQNFFAGEVKGLRTVGPGNELSDTELSFQLLSAFSAGDGVSASFYEGDGRLRIIEVIPSAPNVARCGRRYSPYPQVQRAMASPAARGSMVGRDLQRRKVLTAWATVPGVGWKVFAEQPLSQALAPLRASLWRTAILLGAFLVVAVLVSLVLARRFVRPVRRMQVAAKRIGAGAYDERIDLKRGDELGDLASEFNRMASSLRQSIEGLERKAAERTRELEGASMHKSEFLASMSHELRTPLNAIVGFSQVLREGLFGEPILDLSKVEAGQVELALEADPNIEIVSGDERRIRQVIFNLLSNAVKFTPTGGSVRVTSAQLNGEVHVSIADSGPGIAREDQQRIFEEFQQTDLGAQHNEGTGLGLPLSRRLIELHRGRIWVASKVGEGSTFTFALPLESAT